MRRERIEQLFRMEPVGETYGAFSGTLLGSPRLPSLPGNAYFLCRRKEAIPSTWATPPFLPSRDVEWMDGWMNICQTDVTVLGPMSTLTLPHANISTFHTILKIIKGK